MQEQLDIPSGPSYRVSRSTGMDPNTKRLALIAGGIGGALLLLVGTWSVIGHRSHGVPVIEADSRPVRVKPTNPGGLEITGGDDAILSGLDDSKEGTAPPPEAPAPQALKAAEAKAAAQALAANQPPPAVADQAASLPPPVPAVERSAAPQTAQKVVLSDGPPAAAKQAPATALSAMPEQKPGSHQAAAPAASKPATASAAPTTVSGAQVQLAALTSEEAAMTEWQRLTHKMPELLNAHHPAVLKSERDGHTFYRLRTGGFSDVAQATAFCERVKAKGAGCNVASF